MFIIYKYFNFADEYGKNFDKLKTMVYLILSGILLLVVIVLFALARSEGGNYSKNKFEKSGANDHFNSFTL